MTLAGQTPLTNRTQKGNTTNVAPSHRSGFQMLLQLVGRAVALFQHRR